MRSNEEFLQGEGVQGRVEYFDGIIRKLAEQI